MPTLTPEAPSRTESVTRLRAVVHGHVQGVGFRYWAHHTAQRFGGLSGVVRNRADGAVEVEAESPGAAYLEAFLHELHVGPDAAQVTSVEASWEKNVAPRYTGSLRVG